MKTKTRGNWILNEKVNPKDPLSPGLHKVAEIREILFVNGFSEEYRPGSDGWGNTGIFLFRHNDGRTITVTQRVGMTIGKVYIGYETWIRNKRAKACIRFSADGQ